MSDHQTSQAIAKLEQVWRLLNNDTEGVPNVIFRIGNGAVRGGYVLGSITVNPAWSTADGERHEVFLSGQAMSSPEQALQTLIHEHAHGVAMRRGVKDTSRQYRYHNRRFRTICEELGMVWPWVDVDEDGKTTEAKADARLGFSAMRLPVHTYRDPGTVHRGAVIEAPSFGELGGRWTQAFRILETLDLSIFTAHAGGPPPKRRDKVGMVAASNYAQVGSEQEAMDLLGFEDGDEAWDPQYIGVQVYNGLVERQLLGNHVAWFVSGEQRQA